MIINLLFSLLLTWTIILSYSESFVIHFRDESSRAHGTIQNRNVKFSMDSNIYFPKQQQQQGIISNQIKSNPGNNQNRPLSFQVNNHSKRFKPAIIEFIEDFGIARKPVVGLSLGSSDSWMNPEQLNQHPCGVNYSSDKKYRYDKITKQCYAVGTIGPCGQSMIFYESPDDDINGFCDCIKQKSRTFINHKLTQQCFPIYSQGYCPNGKWLILNSAGQHYCDINPCYANQQQEPYKEFVPFNSRCVEINTNQPECTRNEVVAFVPYQIQPDCTMLQSNRDFALGTLNSRRLSYSQEPIRPVTGSLKKDWNWN